MTTTIKLNKDEEIQLQELKKSYQKVNKGIKITDELMIKICIQREYDFDIKHKDR